MPFSCKVGDSFYLRTDEFVVSHRHVIITFKNSDGKVVLVNFTSVSEYNECVVEFRRKHDRHIFDHPTTIAYGRAMLVEGDGLVQYANNRYYHCGKHITNKIIEGAFLSSDIEPYILKEIKEQYPVEYEKYYPQELRGIDFTSPT